MRLKEIIKKFTDEKIIDEWNESEQNYNAWTDEYTYAVYETDNGEITLDTFDGNLNSQEIKNGVPGTSYIYTAGTFVEKH